MPRDSSPRYRSLLRGIEFAETKDFNGLTSAGPPKAPKGGYAPQSVRTMSMPYRCSLATGTEDGCQPRCGRSWPSA